MMTGLRISDENRTLWSKWTELDGDLGGFDPTVAGMILASRIAMAQGDAPRTPYWKDPEDVDAFTDISYGAPGDTSRAHMLDVYIPHDAVIRGGRSLPVYIDIHGGGFIYGYKELNRNFNTHLAAQGFAAFSLNYRLVPQTGLLGQLADVAQAFQWIADHAGDYPIDPESVFITGDSAGGTLGLYSTAIERSEDMASALGVTQAGLNIKGAAFISGLFDLKPYLDKLAAMAAMASTGGAAAGTPADVGPTDSLVAIAPLLLGGFDAQRAQWADLDFMTANVDLPPLLLNTSNDDFIQAETLKLATALAEHGRDFELYDVHTTKGASLGHVYPVCMTWLDESQTALRRIREFSYKLI